MNQGIRKTNRAAFYATSGSGSLSGVFVVPPNCTRLRVIAQAPGGGGGGSAASGSPGGDIVFTGLFRDILVPLNTTLTVSGGSPGNDVTPGAGGTGPGCYSGVSGGTGTGARSPFSIAIATAASPAIFQFGAGGGPDLGGNGGGGAGAFLDSVFTVLHGQRISFAIGAVGVGALSAGNGGIGIVIFEWGLQI